MKRLLTLVKTKYYVLNFRMLLLLTLPQVSHANQISIETILNKAVVYLTGSVAKSAGLLAILGTGYLTLITQKMPKEQFMMILLGLGVIFGGSSLYSTFVGN